jgi:hypothetical protein
MKQANCYVECAYAEQGERNENHHPTNFVRTEPPLISSIACEEEGVPTETAGHKVHSIKHSLAEVS